MTMNGVMAIILRYFAKFGSFYGSAGASLHEPPPRTTTIGPQFSVIHHTSALAKKICTLPNMRPLSIREPPPRLGYGGPSAGSAFT